MLPAYSIWIVASCRDSAISSTLRIARHAGKTLAQLEPIVETG